ncbi:MAG: hypothetical protein GX417_02840 [Clostridiales bacterium]|nr:hypothetical protein [Clostridiales bacterium]
MKYSPRRRLNLDATSFGPLLKLAVAVLLLAAFVLLIVFVAVPLVTARLESGVPLFGATPAVEAAKATEKPVNPILLNEVETVQFGEGYGLPTAVVDPSVFDGEILFATGASENACDRLVRLNPETGVFVNIDISLLNDTVRYPVESENVILYADCKTAGGGSIIRLDKATGESAVLSEFALDAPKLSLEAPYAVWMERTGEAAAKLIVCDVVSGELLTLGMFTNSPYAESDPSIKSGQVIYADADAANPGDSLIRTVLLSDNSRWDYSAGSFVHDPKSAGDRWAYLSGNHDGNSDLYVSVGGAAAMRVARGVIDFDITPSCVVFSRDETVYAYVFSDNKTYVLSETGTNSQFVMAGGEYALWRDMTNPDQPLWKYIKVVG